MIYLYVACVRRQALDALDEFVERGNFFLYRERDNFTDHAYQYDRYDVACQYDRLG